MLLFILLFFCTVIFSCAFVIPKISKTARADVDVTEEKDKLAQVAGYTDFSAMSDALGNGTTLNVGNFGTTTVSFGGMTWWPVYATESGGGVALTLWLSSAIGSYTFSDGTYGENTTYAANNYYYSWIRAAINAGTTTITVDGKEEAAYYGSWPNTIVGKAAPTQYQNDEKSATASCAPTEFTAFLSFINNPFIIPGGDYGDCLWLPSDAEAQSGGSWGCTSTQSANNGSTGDCWTRSPTTGSYFKTYFLRESGARNFNNVTYAYGIRPAININLTAVDETTDFFVDPDQSKPTANNETFTYNGEEQTYLPTNFNASTMTIANNEQTNAGTYTVTVTSKSGAWSDITFKFTIKKATPNITVDEFTDTLDISSGLPDINDLFLSAVNPENEELEVEGTIAWDTSTPKSGTNTYGWTFTPDNTDNYNNATGTITLTFTDEDDDGDDNQGGGGTTDPTNPDDNTGDDTDPSNPGGSGTTDPTDPNNPGGSGTTDPTDPSNPGGGSGTTDPTDPSNPDGDGDDSNTDGSDDNDGNDDSDDGSGSGGGTGTGSGSTDDGTGDGSGLESGDGSGDGSNDDSNSGNDGSGDGSGNDNTDNSDDNDTDSDDGSGSGTTDPNNPDNNDGSGSGSTDSDNNSDNNSDDKNTSGAGSFGKKILNFLKKSWWWLLIALAVLTLLIIIIVVASRRRKDDDEKKAKKEEKAKREEEQIRAIEQQAPIAAASMVAAQPVAAASMVAAQPVVQPIVQPVQQPVQPVVVQQPNFDLSILAEMRADIAEIKAKQSMPQVNYVPAPQAYAPAPATAPAPQPTAAPAYAFAPAIDNGTLARLEAQMNAMQAEQRARYEAEQHAEMAALKARYEAEDHAEVAALRAEQRVDRESRQSAELAAMREQLNGKSAAGNPAYTAPNNNVNSIPAEVVVALLQAVNKGGAPVILNAAPAPAQAKPAVPPDAVVTTTTTVDRTKNNSTNFDVDGFYDKYE